MIRWERLGLTGTPLSRSRTGRPCCWWARRTPAVAGSEPGDSGSEAPVPGRSNLSRANEAGVRMTRAIPGVLPGHVDVVEAASGHHQVRWALSEHLVGDPVPRTSRTASPSPPVGDGGHCFRSVRSRALVLQLGQGFLQIATKKRPAGDLQDQDHEASFEAAGLAERGPLYPAAAGGCRSGPQLPLAAGAEDVGVQHPGDHQVRVGPVVPLPSPDPPELAAALGDLDGAVAEGVDGEALGVDPRPDLGPPLREVGGRGSDLLGGQGSVHLEPNLDHACLLSGEPRMRRGQVEGIGRFAHPSPTRARRPCSIANIVAAARVEALGRPRPMNTGNLFGELGLSPTVRVLHHWRIGRTIDGTARTSGRVKRRIRPPMKPPMARATLRKNRTTMVSDHPHWRSSR
jgi:hypothetical protein